MDAESRKLRSENVDRQDLIEDSESRGSVDRCNNAIEYNSGDAEKADASEVRAPINQEFAAVQHLSIPRIRLSADAKLSLNVQNSFFVSLWLFGSWRNTGVPIAV